MQILRDEADFGRVADAFLRQLLARRLAELTQGEAYEPEVHGFFVVMAPGDALVDIEAAVGAPLLRNPVTGAVFGDPAFEPVFEYVGRHAGGYELVVVPGDGDFGVVLWVPLAAGIDPRLLALCAEHAVAEPAEP